MCEEAQESCFHHSAFIVMMIPFSVSIFFAVHSVESCVRDLALCVVEIRAIRRSEVSMCKRVTRPGLSALLLLLSRSRITIKEQTMELIAGNDNVVVSEV